MGSSDADGVVRPVIRGEVLAGDGARIQTLFLIDTGADRTVFSANIFTALRRLPLTQTEQLGGVGGRVTAMLVETQIEIQRDDGGIAVFRGQFAALTDPAYRKFKRYFASATSTQARSLAP